MTEGRDRGAAGELAPADRVRLGIDLYNARDLDGLVALIPDGFVHDMRGTGIPGMEVYVGPGAYRRFLEEWLEAFPESQLEIESIETAGEVVFAVIRQEMRGASGGVPVTFRYASVTSIRDGVGTASEFHTDLKRARERFNLLAGAAGA